MAANRPAGKGSRAGAEESSLVEAAQKDPTRFGDLYEIHFELIYAFIVRRVRDRDTAEDLTSDVFYKALANLQNYEWRGAPFAAWLIRIAANVVADELKRSAGAKLAAREIWNPKDLQVTTAEPNLEAIEPSDRLFRFVNDLPADQRRVIFERFVEQKGIREIAQQLGRTEGAVKQVQFRALQGLRKQMEVAHA